MQERCYFHDDKGGGRLIKAQEEIINPQDIVTRLNTCADLYFGYKWQKNARENVHNKNFKRIQSLEFHPDRIAMVCGSAPSLKLHYDLIKEHRDKIDLFAADTTFGILLKEGIVADFVFNVDASECLTGNLAFLDYTKCPKTAFIFAVTSDPRAINSVPHKQLYFYSLISDNATLNNASLLFPKLGTIESKANVGEFMVYVATRYFGYKNIIMSGIDFSYTPDLYYADASIDEVLQKDDMLGKQETMVDSDGQPVLTTLLFKYYMYLFMNNYQNYYAKQANILNLNKGILPLKYQIEEAEELLASWSLK